MDKLRTKAKNLGASEFGMSESKGKRFYVIYQDKRINFGSDNGKTFIDHGNEVIRKNWYARHSKIKNKAGKYVINDKTSPSYWSHQILWK